MMNSDSPSISVVGLLQVSLVADLWLSCHGYESRSIAHLDRLQTAAARRISFGFPFPTATDDSEASRRVFLARERLAGADYETPVLDDAGFDLKVREIIHAIDPSKPCKIVADISSMSRSRIASLLIALSDHGFSAPCKLELIYFPASFATHKHSYEPLEYFGPCHTRLCGWPDDADMPLALVMGLGTEPRRADGVVEVLEPDILAVYVPVGDEQSYSEDLQAENRRVLEVCGEPINYSIRAPADVFASLQATGARLSERSRVVFVPMGPKLFAALTVAAALAIGPEVGVWKASAGTGVEPVDVQAGGDPVLLMIVFKNE